MDTIIWLICAVLFIVVEMATVGLVSVWFALGALASLICSLFTDIFWIEAVVFIAISVVALICTRPLVKKWHVQNVTKTNFDRIIGMSGTVTENIDNLNATGYISVDGKEWMARTENEEEKINVGVKVRVLRIEGAKVIVAAEKN